MWKQAQITQTWAQASYFGDTYIFSKRLDLEPLVSKGYCGSSSVFIIIAPIVAASKRGCLLWHKRQCGGDGYIRVLSVCSENLIWHHRIKKELYTVVFIGIAFQNILLKHCKVSDVSELRELPTASDGAAPAFKTWIKAVDLLQ